MATLTAERLPLLFEPIERFDDMHGQSDRPSVVGNRATDRLPDPPCGVGGELESAAELESIHRLHQAEVSFLNQIEKRKPAVHVSLRDGDDETEIRLHHESLFLANGILGCLDAGVAPAELRARQAHARV